MTAETRTPPRRNNLLIILIIAAVAVVGGCVLCVVVTGGGVLAIFGLTQGVRDAGNNFFTALEAEDYDAAYALLSEDAQDSYGSAEGLQGDVLGEGVVPVDWNFTNTSVNNNIGELEGTYTDADDNTGNLTVDLVQEDGSWRVTGWDFDS